jgi:glycosyltransferase involved in cell wall biosynthesis
MSSKSPRSRSDARVQKRILAVGHDAYRAGAQIVLLHILRWLRQNHEAEISLVLKADGELLDEYTKVLPTRVLQSRRVASSRPSLMSLPGRVSNRLQAHRDTLEPGSIDLIYANSAASATVAADLAAKAGCPAICHVHELDMSIRRFATRFSEVSEHFDRYIAVSRAVERNLVVNHGIDTERIDRIYAGIPVPEHVGTTAHRSQLRAELDIPLNAFVVGGCGTVDWRKGPDVFLLVAKALSGKLLGRPVHFLWVGGESESLEMLQHDVERLGLADTVSFIGQRPDPMRYFALFDAFLLTSREDPFPLVCLEAAALEVPIVCFADAGGIPEFVEDDAGYVVAYLDIESAADALLSLVGSERTRATLGHRAAEKVAERCSIDVIGPQIAAVLDRCLY